MAVISLIFEPERAIDKVLQSELVNEDLAVLGLSEEGSRTDRKARLKEVLKVIRLWNELKSIKDA